MDIPIGGQRYWKPAGLPAWLWSGGEVLYDLPIPPQEAARRLAGAVRPRSVVTYLGFASGLVGWVDGDRFRFTIRTPMFNNSYEPYFQGVVEAAPAGSRIRGQLRMRQVVLVFMIIWIVLAAAISLPAGISALTDPRAWQAPGPPRFVPFLIPVSGAAFWVVGRLIASRQERRLVRRLDELFGVWVADDLA